MSFKLLNFVLKANRFFGVAPPLKKCSIISKLYSSAILTALTVGTVVSVLEREYLLTYTHIKLVITVLSDIVAYIFDFYATLYMTFTQEKKWCDLVRIIKTKEVTNEKTYCLSFICLNVVFWIILIPSNYLFTHIVVFKSLLDIIVLNFALYTQFLFGCLAYVTLTMILSKQYFLNKLLSDYVDDAVKIRSISGDDFLHFIRKVEYVAYSLKESVEHFNDVFGIPLLLMISYSTLHFVNYIDDFFFFRFASDKFKQFVASNMCLVSMVFAGNCVLITKCDSVVKEAGRTVFLAYKLRRLYPGVLTKEREELNQFIDFAVNNLPKFSAGGYFAIQKSTIFGILSTITTLLIVMIQFDATADY